MEAQPRFQSPGEYQKGERGHRLRLDAYRVGWRGGRNSARDRVADDDRHACGSLRARAGRMTLAPHLPEDFDAFWSETVEQALNAPLDFDRKPGNAFNSPGFIVEIFRFTSVS